MCPALIFDTSDNSNTTHYFAFSTNPNNSPAAPYTTGVTTTGVSGQAGSNTTINVAPVWHSPDQESSALSCDYHILRGLSGGTSHQN